MNRHFEFLNEQIRKYVVELNPSEFKQDEKGQKNVLAMKSDFGQKPLATKLMK